MSILSRNQYNLGMDKYKLLSSTAGVGAIIAAKTGNYILISSINKWPYILKANRIIDYVKVNSIPIKVLEESSKRIKDELGLYVVDDQRFVEFLKISESLTKLTVLLPVPEIELNDFLNTPVWNNRRNPEYSHPIKRQIVDSLARDYTVQASHFPKWFVGSDNTLQTLDDWRNDWAELVSTNNNVSTNHFAPPRDPKSIKSRDVRRKTDADGNYETMDIYNGLTQTNLALICDHGHLMDIPWEKYITTNNFENEPVNLNDIGACCGNPSLKWTESNNKSEGFENVFVQCDSCGTKKNLGGINSFKCFCKGHKPWEMDMNGGFQNQSYIPVEPCDYNGKQGVMQVSLVTANRMYYATGKNSLFIPLEIKPEGFENQDLVRFLSHLKTLFEIEISENGKLDEPLDQWIEENAVKAVLKASGINNAFLTEENIELIRSKTKAYILNDYLQPAFKLFKSATETLEDKLTWFNEKMDEDWLTLDVGGLNENFVNTNFQCLKEHLNNHFFSEETNESLAYDEENYRLFEYKAFTENPDVDEKGLRFNNVNLSEKLTQYFKSIKQVSELKLTQVQLSFNRNKPRIAYKDKNGDIAHSSNSKTIFEGEDTLLLPAVQNYGEGIFFQFNDDTVSALNADPRIQNILNKNLNSEDQGYGTWEMLSRSGQKYFIVHSFSHLIMRELEFACGYPTASLKERLYISSEENEFMAGVLIYTTDGSEGSMGGLVSQASEYNIENLIENALLRGVDCSSDPLCWESEGQGLFDFNLSACFSCSLVAETACEAMNLGLDRRVLVDGELGYFKELIA